MYSKTAYKNYRPAIFILVILIVSVTAIDSRIFEITQQISVERPGASFIMLYSIFVALFIASNICLLIFVRNMYSKDRSTTKYAYVGVWINQSLMSCLLVFSLIQMILYDRYSNFISLVIIYLSQVSAIVFLGLLSLRLFSWLRSRPNYTVTMYAIGFTMILILTMISIPYLSHRLQDKTPMVEPRPYRLVKLLEAVPTPLVEYAHMLSYYIFAALVVTTWIVTVSMLKHYSGKSSNLKFWGVVSIPLIYLLFHALVTLRIEWGSGIGLRQTLEAVFFFQITNQIVGVFFGLTFWITSRRVKRERLKNSLIAIAAGIILMFSSIEVGLILLPVYPPFGLITLAFAGLASFLLMVGIINSASIVAKDTELRRELFKSLTIDSKMLSSMGEAECRREIENKVTNLVNRSSEIEVEEPRYDLEPDQIERVINEVLIELGKKR